MSLLRNIIFKVICIFNHKCQYLKYWVKDAYPFKTGVRSGYNSI